MWKARKNACIMNLFNMTAASLTLHGLQKHKGVFSEVFYHCGCPRTQVFMVEPRLQNVLRCHKSPQNQQRVQRLFSCWESPGGH